MSCFSYDVASGLGCDCSSDFLTSKIDSSKNQLSMSESETVSANASARNTTETSRSAMSETVTSRNCDCGSPSYCSEHWKSRYHCHLILSLPMLPASGRARFWVRS